MPISHADRKQMKKDVYEHVVAHILICNKPMKINDLYEQFHEDVFKSIPYFVRTFVLLQEEDSRIHVKSAQRAGTWAAPIDIEFAETLKTQPKKKNNKKLTADTGYIKEDSEKEKSSESTNEQSKEKHPHVDMTTDHERDIPIPTSSEIFGDKESDNSEEWEEDRFFTNEDREYEGKLTDIEPDDKWYSINKRLLTKAGYTDVVELYKFDDDHTHEYLAITSEGKTFHFIETD